MIKKTHSINIKLTEEQYLVFQEIKKKSGKTISSLIRENLLYFNYFYQQANK
jgi:hypothetical protein